MTLLVGSKSSDLSMNLIQSLSAGGKVTEEDKSKKDWVWDEEEELIGDAVVKY